MKVIVRGNKKYQLDTLTNKVTPAPDKCLSCNKLKHENEACKLEECEKDIQELIKNKKCTNCGACNDFDGVCVLYGIQFDI